MNGDFAAFLDEILPKGWEHDAGTYGMDCSLTCPHGHTIEQDGHCPEGCVSPLIGVIL
jgi:hypothetical protein